MIFAKKAIRRRTNRKVRNGRAEKAQVQYMVTAILGLEKIPKPDDAADALAVAITHANFNQSLI